MLFEFSGGSRNFNWGGKGMRAVEVATKYY